MSRVLVLGVGTPGFVPARRHAGPGLRSAHLATALARAGHDVLVVAVRTKHDEPEDGIDAACTYRERGDARPIAVEFVREQDLLAPATRRRIDAFDPDAVVGATVYAAALAARMKIDAPLWADVFGDIMAEAQAKAARTGSDWALVHFWTMLSRVLASADRFSAVSAAQSNALVGQLGLAGRLSSRTAGEELVATIPCASEPATAADREASRRAMGISPDEFVLLISGGVNTWCDIDTIVAGVSQAIAADERISVVVTGGSIPGHDESSHAELAAGLRRIVDRNPGQVRVSKSSVETSGPVRVLKSAVGAPVRDVSSSPGERVRVLGWIPSGELARIYAACDLALHIERPLYERRLGAENRVVEWLAHGLPFVTTALSETTTELVRSGIAFRCDSGDAGALAAAIAHAKADEAGRADAARRGRKWIAATRGYSTTAEPLVRWCESPRHARDHDGARLVSLGLLSHPETSVELLEAYVAALPLSELARRAVRWTWRRAAQAVRASTARVRSLLGRDAGATRARRDAASGSGWTSLAMFVVVAAATAFVGCHRGATARPNILLISIDTLRADHVGAYGYGVKPSPTPSIDRLAAEGVLFEQATSSAPETAPALATLVTGIYQDRHEVLFNRANLADEQQTVAESLKAAGYATRAFLANWLVDPSHGFGQGFDSVEMISGGTAGYTSTDDRVVAAVAAFLRSPPDEPWFAWVHMMDPHGPYNSASPWWSAPFDYSAAPIARDGEFPVSDSNFGLGVIPAYQKQDSSKTLADYVRRYDGEIRFTDAQVGALLGHLAASGEAAETVVVLTADHGESLVEHNELLQHGWFTYDTTVRVPLVVAWPENIAPAKRVAAEVCTVDIVPTILDLAGAGDSAEGLDGRSLAADLGLEGSDRAGELRAAGCYSIGPRANHPISLRTAKLKAIVTPAGAPTDPRAPKGERTDAPQRIELYDLVADPGESVNIAESRAAAAGELLPAVEKLRRRFRENGWRW